MSNQRARFKVGDLHVDVAGVRVTRGGSLIDLPKLSFDLLVALIEIAPAVATTDALLERVWPGIVVNAETVAQRVKLLRAALGDDARHPRYVAPVRGRGYRLVADVTLDTEEPVALDAPATRSARARPAFAGSHLVLAVLLFSAGISIVVALARLREPQQPLASPLPDRTIAVLPFQTLSPPVDGAFLGAAFADSISHNLAGSSRVTVIARNSAFALQDRGLTATQIGRQLNARYLLTGTVQQQQQSLRVTATLVDASIDRNVWSTSFDRKAQDILAVQDDIARKVARALSVTLDASVDDRARQPGTLNLDAYMDYLRGRELTVTERADDLRAAIVHLQRAIALDPGFSAAYSALAWARFTLLGFTSSDSLKQDTEATWKDVQALATKALELNPRNADAWQMLAATADDGSRSEAFDRKAVALEPSSASAQFGLSLGVLWNVYEGAPERLDETISLMERAAQLDPLNPKYPRELATIYLYYRSSELDKAEPLLNRALQLDPQYVPAMLRLAELRFCCQSRVADAIRLMEEALRIDPGAPGARRMLAHMYLSIDDDAAAEQLIALSNERAGSWAALHAHRHEWRQAAALAYDDEAAYTLNAPDNLAAEFAVLMDALESGRYDRARGYFERTGGFSESADGKPRLRWPFQCCMGSVVALGDLARRAGDEARATRLLEFSLSAMDKVSVQYRRGEVWFNLSRSRALALLGRREQAFEVLDKLGQSGLANFWRRIEVDPAYDAMRNDARFRAIVARQVAKTQEARAAIADMRRQGLIPLRPG